MNNNIKDPGDGQWEVDRTTDHQQEVYSQEQGKRLIKLSEVKEGEKFRVPNSSRDVVWTRTAEDEQYMGGVEQGNVRWHVRVVSDTIVQLVEEPVDRVQYLHDWSTSPIEPVPDAIVDTVVSDLSVGGDLLSEQIQKIRERNVPEIARMTIQEAIGRYGMNKLTNEQKQEVGNWAEQQLQNTDMDKELEKEFTDMLLHNREMYHVTEDKIEHIPYTPEKWDEIHSKHSTDDIQDPVSVDNAIKFDYNALSPTWANAQPYQTLEEILQDIQNVQMFPYHLRKDSADIRERMKKTIQSGAYIQQNGTI